MSDLFSAGLVRVLQASNDNGSIEHYDNSTTEAPSAVNTSLFQPSSNEPSNESSSKAYEFIAFILWYICLVLCCIVPTYFAYRRRRILEARFAQQHARHSDAITTLEQLQQWELSQQNQLFLATNGLPNSATILLQRQDLFQAANDLMDSDTAKAERTRRLEESLKETTFVVQEGDLSDNSTATTAEGSSTCSKEDTIVNSRQLQHLEDAALADLDVTSVLQLPSDENSYDNRTTPAVCAICLCGYEVGDRVAWSQQCHHAFHHECIVPWLAKKNDAKPKCPCCRQVYCQIEPITFTDLINSNDYNGVLTSTPGTIMTTTPTLTPLEFMVAVRSGGNGLFIPHQYRIHQLQQQQQQHPHNGNTRDEGVTVIENDHGINQDVDTVVDIEHESNSSADDRARQNTPDNHN